MRWQGTEIEVSVSATRRKSIFVIPVAKAPSQKETEDCDNDPVNLPPELPKFISCLTLESGLCVI